jgi:hypothetical protein
VNCQLTLELRKNWGQVLNCELPIDFGAQTACRKTWDASNKWGAKTRFGFVGLIKVGPLLLPGLCHLENFGDEILNLSGDTQGVAADCGIRKSLRQCGIDRIF